MKTVTLLALILLLSACTPPDHRSPTERARDNAAACLEIGGTAHFKKYALGIYVTCDVDETS